MTSKVCSCFDFVLKKTRKCRPGISMLWRHSTFDAGPCSLLWGPIIVKTLGNTGDVKVCLSPSEDWQRAPASSHCKRDMDAILPLLILTSQRDRDALMETRGKWMIPISSAAEPHFTSKPLKSIFKDGQRRPWGEDKEIWIQTRLDSKTQIRTMIRQGGRAQP